jgi:hypothetical protein
MSMAAKYTGPVQTGPEDQPASCKMGTGSSFPGVKRPGRSVDHRPPYRAEVKESVKLYLQLTPVPTWHVTGQPLPVLPPGVNAIAVDKYINKFECIFLFQQYLRSMSDISLEFIWQSYLHKDLRCHVKKAFRSTCLHYHPRARTIPLFPSSRPTILFTSVLAAITTR